MLLRHLPEVIVLALLLLPAALKAEPTPPAIPREAVVPAEELAAPPIGGVAANCPDGRDAMVGDDLVAYEAWLAAHLPGCLNDAPFLAWHGAVLNRLGRHQAAADQLERALLLDPRLMGARIDYADALAATGQAAAARQLLNQILQRPDIPPAIAGSIARSLEQELAWDGALAIALRLGRDSNLNRATQAGQLALTLPGGEIWLPIDEKNRARSGASHLLEVQGQTVKGLEGGQYLHLFGELRQRVSPSGTDTNYLQSDVAALWRRPVNGGGKEASLSLAAGNLAYGGNEIYRYLRVGLARDWGRVRICQPFWGFNVEQRDYPGSRMLDHHFYQLQTTWVCGSQNPFNLQLGIGRELSKNGDVRPGGNAKRIDSRIFTIHPLGNGFIEGELRYSQRRDEETFSPLLNNGEPLRLHSFSARLEYRHNFTRHWQGLASVEAGAQNANLALYDLHNRAAHLGLRWQW